MVEELPIMVGREGVRCREKEEFTLVHCPGSKSHWVEYNRC